MEQWNNCLIQYDLSEIIHNPDAFNDHIVEYLKNTFEDELFYIVSRLCSCIDKDLIIKNWNKLERQILPALVLFNRLKTDQKVVYFYCTEYIKGFALPILLLDDYIDSKDSDCKDITLTIAEFILRSRLDTAQDSGWERAYPILTHNYLREIQSLQNQFKSRYTIPNDLSYPLVGNTIELALKSTHGSLHRSFLAVVSSVLSLSRLSVSLELTILLEYFGLLRQFTDEISDVEEDLTSGIITLPIIATFRYADIRHNINRYWKGEISFSEMDLLFNRANAYCSCFDICLSIYEECSLIKDKLKIQYPFLDDLFIFFDLKLCLLYRLKNNDWRDNKRKY